MLVAAEVVLPSSHDGERTTAVSVSGARLARSRYRPTVADAQRTIGPWTVFEELGHGGNATVYRAIRTGADEPPVALKVLNRRKIESEPYRRFVQEINFLREHGDDPGVLPFLEFNLPDAPSNSDPAWLAMPIATPIGESLKESSVEEIVAAIRTIAQTLARLAAAGIGHRDVKPGNLYELNRQYLVGDFGLVAVPTGEALTVAGRQLGPAHFVSHEMVLHADTASPYPADVFALMKTLWVLMTGQNFPPDGHQVAGTRQLCLADLRPHRGAAALDQLIDRATVVHPELRPTMEQVVRDLDAWEMLESHDPSEIDVSSLRARLHAALPDEIAAHDTEQRYRDLFPRIVDRLLDLSQPLEDAIGDLQLPVTNLRSGGDALTANKLVLLGHNVPRLNRMQLASVTSPYDFPGAMTLRMARVLELYADGELFLLLRITVAAEGVQTPGIFHWTLPLESAKAPIGSIEFDRVLEAGVAELAVQLERALEVFVAAIAPEL